MNKKISPWNIGSSLYIPANNPNIVDIIIHNKYSGLKSVIICLEDSIKVEDFAFAKDNLLKSILHITEHLNQTSAENVPLIFIRPRNIDNANWIITNLNLTYVAGFVIAKFDQNCLNDWWSILQNTQLLMMPTLETQDVYNVVKMQQLSDTLSVHPCRNRIILLRIGGNDLMNGLRLRRHKNMTIYDGPVGYLIKMLVVIFAQNGFYLTAPVCEHFSDNDLLAKEVALDILHGLVGKTLIHPSQLDIINQIYQVTEHEYTEAKQIISVPQGGVFNINGSMCEPSTQHRWASDIIERAQCFGIN